MRSFERGVIYTAIHEFCVREAQVSARSVRTFLPDVGIILFTDCPPEDNGVFDEVVRLTTFAAVPHLDKLACMRDSPFRETLYLDTDTYVCGPIDGLFDLLKEFDIAMALERRYQDLLPKGVVAPAAFPEFNQGVVAFRQSDRMKTMFQSSLDWADDVHARTGSPTDDQAALRATIYASGLRIAPLPLEFNCRFHTFGYLNGAVKILHARIPGQKHTAGNLEKVARRINKDPFPRVFVAGQVHALAFARPFSVEHIFARRSATLFRPWWVLSKALLKRAARNVARPIERLVKRRRKT